LDAVQKSPRFNGVERGGKKKVGNCANERKKWAVSKEELENTVNGSKESRPLGGGRKKSGELGGRSLQKRGKKKESGFKKFCQTCSGGGQKNGGAKTLKKKKQNQAPDKVVLSIF